MQGQQAFYWTDGSTLSYTAWEYTTGQPGTDASETVVVWTDGAGGKWHDWGSGASVYPGVCKKKTLATSQTLTTSLSTSASGRCGPLFNHVRCGGTGVTEYPAGAIYCNEANGWCGNTEEHRNAQPSTEYDFIAASETLVNNALFATPFGAVSVCVCVSASVSVSVCLCVTLRGVVCCAGE